MDRIENGDRALVAQIPLHRQLSDIPTTMTIEQTKNISIATCLLLSWKLLMYARETLLVASDRTP